MWPFNGGDDPKFKCRTIFDWVAEMRFSYSFPSMVINTRPRTELVTVDLELKKIGDYRIVGHNSFNG